MASTPQAKLGRIQHEQRITKACPVLHPTGCTTQFCQSGRMTRPLEPKVGENRPIHNIHLEAEAFLSEMYDEGLFTSGHDFESRLQQVLAEIDSGAVQTKVWVDSEVTTQDYVELKRVQVDGYSSSGWQQNRRELEWGVRVAWRNARKCIMRAHSQDLVLVDLRDITTSQGMIDSMIARISDAYNEGRIKPTVFMFPPRGVDGMGPVFWSSQLLTFAGYEMLDGTILGDPTSIQITKDIMDLGWAPPWPRSRWDILPIVASAEGDEPAWGVLPSGITDCIRLEHPEYEAAFSSLDLRWCKFPALSKLGFDIGGVQYTASPFVGWFMDAEIAVRDLADTFRYNVLPEVCKVIGWRKKGTEFGDLPDHERLLWLSRAQAELNYAIHYSFMKAGVTSSTSLGASESWLSFDDQHLQEKGYRLNADPYWIAPPQGSIIPVWHRGGAPNYQPKPLIAKNHYDAAKIWRANLEDTSTISQAGSDTSETTLAESLPEDLPRVHILWTGTSDTTLKLAERLRKDIQNHLEPVTLCHFGNLNSVSPDTLQHGDFVLLVISTTGQGQVPSNGQRFMEKMKLLEPAIFSSLRYSIFGLGDSAYSSTFNGAAVLIERYLQDHGASPCDGLGLYKSDVATRIHHSLPSSLGGINSEQEFLQQLAMIDSCHSAPVTFDPQAQVIGRMMEFSLVIGRNYNEMGHVRVIPQNSDEDVTNTMSILNIIEGSRQDTIKLPFVTGTKELGIRQYLTEYVDLEQPFRNLNWLPACPFLSHERFQGHSAMKILTDLATSSHSTLSTRNVYQILLSLTPFRPRCYSIASSPSYRSTSAISKSKHVADFLIRVLPNGRFSSQTLGALSPASSIRYKIDVFNRTASLAHTNGSIVAVACGTGFGPVRSLIQMRVARAQLAFFSLLGRPNSKLSPEMGRLSLFLGFKQEDSAIFTETVDEAREYGVLDGVHLIPSNVAKKRMQDVFEEQKELLHGVLGRELCQEGWLYICGSSKMTSDVKLKMAGLGMENWENFMQNGRVIEEDF